MSTHRFKVSTFLLGAAVGAAIALVHLWALPFTLRGLVGVLAGGAVTGTALAAGVSLAPRVSGFRLYAGAVGAGALGGAAWWLIVRPPSSLFLAALIGALMVLFMVVVEDASEPRSPDRAV